MPHDGWHPHGFDHHDEHGNHQARPAPLEIGRRLLLAAASFLPFGSASAQTVEAGDRIAQAASRLLTALDDGQRKKALIVFDSVNREDWHYIPRSRQGLPLGEMTEAQRQAARTLFASVLNDRGLQMIDNVRVVEAVLREQQGSFRDPDRYYVSVFGTPGRFPWGWRLEGHHLSLNVTLAAAGHITATPFFVGSHPATVREGPHKGLRPLGASEDLARQLMASLPEQARRIAIISDRSFGEIVTSPGRERDLGTPRGIDLASLNGAARNLVEALMDRFLGALSPDLAARQKQRVIEQELSKFRFAWAGSLTPGETHYFRVHGPVTLIEHDNTQNDGNHVHSVWRDLKADFGHDALAEHYRTSQHR